MIRNAYTRFEQQNGTQAFIGQPQLGGSSLLTFLPDGATTTLSFLFADPNTNLPVTGPTIGSVVYTANLDPNSPNTFVPIGTSTDAATNFSIPYTVSGFEPYILATPYDTSGNQIIAPGSGGFDVAAGGVVALAVPEPAAVVMLGMGLAAVVVVAVFARNRRPGHPPGRSAGSTTP